MWFARVATGAYLRKVEEEVVLSTPHDERNGDGQYGGGDNGYDGDAPCFMAFAGVGIESEHDEDDVQGRCNVENLHCRVVNGEEAVE